MQQDLGYRPNKPIKTTDNFIDNLLDKSETTLEIKY